MIRWLSGLFTVALSLPVAAAPAPVISTPTTQAPAIHPIRLSQSNAFLVATNPPLLIDTGCPEDLAALQAGLAAHGVALAQIKAILLTHGHADHAGLVAEIKRRHGTVVLAGNAEGVMTRAGHNDDIKPTNLTARLLKRFAINPRYEAFEADIKVDRPIDLKALGLNGKAIPMPGHTPGSLVFVLDDGRAVVGDMMLGGWLGGAFFADRAGEHYFQDDAQRNRANITELLRLPLHTFYLGHGGPVSRASVLKGFDLTEPRADTASAHAQLSP